MCMILYSEFNPSNLSSVKTFKVNEMNTHIIYFLHIVRSAYRCNRCYNVYSWPINCKEKQDFSTDTALVFTHNRQSSFISLKFCYQTSPNTHCSCYKPFTRNFESTRFSTKSFWQWKKVDKQNVEDMQMKSKYIYKYEIFGFPWFIVF